MKKTLLQIILLLSLTSCSSRHNIPIATLKFDKLKLAEKDINNLFKISFSSSHNIGKAISSHQGFISYSQKEFICLFIDNDIAEKDLITYNGYLLRSSVINPKYNPKSDLQYSYNYTAFFLKSIDGTGSRPYHADMVEDNKMLEVISQLKQPPSNLRCVVIAWPTISPIKKDLYISNTMLLPKSEILKALKPFDN